MEIFEKFAEIPVGTWCALVLITLFGIALLSLTPRVRWNAKMLAYAALCIAIGFVLSYIRLMRMPQGGAITPASMLPVMLFAYAFGMGPGLICGVAYGLLQMLQDMYLVGWVQAILDYPLAFGMLALTALFRRWKSPVAFSLGVLVAGSMRVICHVLSGVVFFAEYAGDMNPLVYSLVYNLSSVGIDALLCAVIGFLPPVRRFAGKMASSGNRL